MREIINIQNDFAIPTIEKVLQNQGIPLHVKPKHRILKIAEEATKIFRKKAKPVGLLSEISKIEFANIFFGEGKNEIDSPIEKIFSESDALAIFAVTIGEDVCSEISSLFRENDFALGSFLDGVASEAAEVDAQFVEDYYKEKLSINGHYNHFNGILRFSPGYCGWHISAQKKLFQTLHPEDIGISLNASFLMQPLKSISGVIIAGKREIFEFNDTFSFCKDCTAHICRDRINALFKN